MDFYFTKSSVSNWNCKIKVWGQVLANPDANAGVELYNSAGTKITTPASTPPTSNPGSQAYNWTHVSVLISTDYLNSLATSGNYVPLRRTMCHELGHAIGLAHCDDNGRIMYAKYNGRTATVPTTADIKLVIYKYS